VVVAGKRLFVFDAGSGSARNIGRLGFVLGHVEAVFLTHFHSDHIDGLGELMLQRWVTTSNTAPVPVYGPPGVDQVVAGLRQAYAQDQHYRVAHHGDATVPASAKPSARTCWCTRPCRRNSWPCSNAAPVRSAGPG
jgi:ribonuclease Z